jgi:hypothetical protein
MLLGQERRMVGWRNGMPPKEKDESSVGEWAKNKTDKETRRKDSRTRELKKPMDSQRGGMRREESRLEEPTKEKHAREVEYERRAEEERFTALVFTCYCTGDGGEGAGGARGVVGLEGWR